MRVQKKLAGMLAGAMLVSMMTTGAGAATFTDMPSNWSTTALQKAVDNGLIQGNNGKINAEGLLTRAEMATIVNRAFGASKTASVTQFTDVSSSAWYYADMQKAVQMGTFQGSGNKLNPDKNITREEAFTVLARAFHMENGSETALSAFSDRASVSSWATGPIAALVAGGYVNGSNGKLTPTASITRAEFAQIMDNLVATYAPSTFTGTVSGNAIVKTAETTFKDATVTGDLVIGDGVGTGNVTLENTNVSGRLVVRGGGVDSIHINGTSSISEVVVDNPSGGVRIAVANTAKVNNLVVSGGSENVILTGPIAKVQIASANAPVEFRTATVGELSVTAERADVTVDKDSKVTTLSVDRAAANTTLTVAGTVTTLNTAADSLTVDGSGKIEKMTVSSGKDVTIDKSVTVVKVDNKSDSNVTVGGEQVKPDGTTDTDKDTDKDDDSNTSSTRYRYRVSVAQMEHGKVVADILKTNTANTKVTLSVQPDAGYALKEGSLSVMRGMTVVPLINNAFVMNEAGAYSVSAIFVREYKMVVNEAQNGTLTYILNDDTLTLFATPDAGYKVDKVTVKVGSAAPQEITLVDGAYTYRMINDDDTYIITATFTAVPTKPYKVVKETVQNGTLTYTIAGDTLTILATPAAGYKVDKVTVKVGSAAPQEITLAGGAYTYRMSSYDNTYTIAATFTVVVPKRYNVVAETVENGRLTYEISGDTLIVTATPSHSNYKLEGDTVVIKANGGDVTVTKNANGKYSATLSSEELTYRVTATFYAYVTVPTGATYDTYKVGADTCARITFEPSDYVVGRDTVTVTMKRTDDVTSSVTVDHKVNSAGKHEFTFKTQSDVTYEVKKTPVATTLAVRAIQFVQKLANQMF